MTASKHKYNYKLSLFTCKLSVQAIKDNMDAGKDVFLKVDLSCCVKS